MHRIMGISIIIIHLNLGRITWVKMVRCSTIVATADLLLTDADNYGVNNYALIKKTADIARTWKGLALAEIKYNRFLFAK